MLLVYFPLLSYTADLEAQKSGEFAVQPEATDVSVVMRYSALTFDRPAAVANKSYKKKFKNDVTHYVPFCHRPRMYIVRALCGSSTTQYKRVTC